MISLLWLRRFFSDCTASQAFTSLGKLILNWQFACFIWYHFVGYIYRTINVPIAASTLFVLIGSMEKDSRVQYKFNIPLELKEKLEAAASENNRSLSGEVVARLEQAFSVHKRLGDLEDDTEANIGDLYRRVEELERQMREMHNPDMYNT
jgi:hypothetical protein